MFDYYEEETLFERVLFGIPLMTLPAMAVFGVGTMLLAEIEEIASTKPAQVATLANAMLLAVFAYLVIFVAYWVFDLLNDDISYEKFPIAIGVFAGVAIAFAIGATQATGGFAILLAITAVTYAAESIAFGVSYANLRRNEDEDEDE